MGRSFIPLEQNVPVTLDEEDFQYAYECKQCGHKWIEVVHKEERLR